MAQPPASGASGPRRRWRRIAIALAGVAGLLLLVAMVAPIGLARVLEDALEARLGGQVRLSMSTSILGPRPGVEIHALNWRPASPVEATVTIGSIQIDTDWVAHEGVRAAMLRLRDVRIELRETPDGRWPLPSLATGDVSDGGGAGGLALGGVALAQAQLRLVPRSGAPADLMIEHAELRADGDGWQLALAGRAQQARGQWAGQVAARIKPAADALVIDSLSMAGAGRLETWPVPELSLTAQGLHLAAGRADADTIELLAKVLRADHASGGTAVQARFRGVRLDSSGVRAMIDSLALTQAEPDPRSIELESVQLTQSAAAVRVAPLRGTARLTRGGGTIVVEAQDGALDYTLASGQTALTDGRLQLQFPDPKTPTATVSAVATVSGAGVPADGRGEGQVRLVLEDSTLDARWALDLAQTPPLRLTAQVDQLDLDRWLPAPGDSTTPARLTIWRDWPLHADLMVGRLTWHGVTLSQARVTFGDADPPGAP